MCTGAMFHQEGKIRQVWFKQLSAKLPIKRINSIYYVCWGRRFQEPGRLPTGSHILLKDLDKKLWKNFLIKSVKVPLSAFEMINIMGEPEWFRITDGQFVEGALIEEEKEKRVYIVTIIPKSLDRRFEKWPRILVDKF